MMDTRNGLSRAALLLMVLLVVAVGVLGRIDVHAQTTQFVPVTDAMLQDPEPENWLMWRRTLDSWGYSPLDEIDRSNVDEIRMVWSRALAPGLQQGTPLVYNGVMYMPNPRDVIQAIDAVTGDLIWEYRRDRPDDGNHAAHGGEAVPGDLGNPFRRRQPGFRFRGSERDQPIALTGFKRAGFQRRGNQRVHGANDGVHQSEHRERLHHRWYG